MKITKMLIVGLSGFLATIFICTSFAEIVLPEKDHFPERTAVAVTQTELGTEIKVILGEKSDLDVAVLGKGEKKLRALFQGSLEKGEYTLTWDGKDDTGMQLPPGPYAVDVHLNGAAFYREGFFTSNPQERKNQNVDSSHN